MAVAVAGTVVIGAAAAAAAAVAGVAAGAAVAAAAAAAAVIATGTRSQAEGIVRGPLSVKKAGLSFVL